MKKTRLKFDFVPLAFIFLVCLFIFLDAQLYKVGVLNGGFPFEILFFYALALISFILILLKPKKMLWDEVSE